MKFYECEDCNSLHIHENREELVCDNCGGNYFEQLHSNIIIQCPMCKNYWPKHVLRLISEEGLLECPSKTCHGLLMVRKEGKPPETVTETEPDVEADLEKEQQKEPEESTELKQQKAPELEPEGELEEEKEESEEKQGSQPERHKEIKNQPKMEGGVDQQIAKSTDQPTQMVREHKTLSLQTSPMVQPIETPDVDLFLDEENISGDIQPDLYKIYLKMYKKKTPDEILLKFDEYKSIFSAMFSHIRDIQDYRIEEPVQNVFYVGDLKGDFERLQALIKFFFPLIETYPSVKIVFLGDYFGEKGECIHSFIALCLFSIVFPENVVLVRGSEDFRETLDRLRLHEIIQNTISDKKSQADDIYRFVFNILRKLPLYHIGSMNQGQIRIMGVNESIPVNPDDPDSPVVLKNLTKNQIKLDFAKIDLDKIAKSFYEGKVEPTQLYSFFKENNLHYVMKGAKNGQEGVEFNCNDLCCEVNSTGSEPKIVKLSPGEPPAVLSIDEEKLIAELRNNFGIETEN